VFEIERLSWWRPRYTLRDDRGPAGTWSRDRFRETMSGDLDGQRYEFGRAGRRHFFLAGAAGIRGLARAHALQPCRGGELERGDGRDLRVSLLASPAYL